MNPIALLVVGAWLHLGASADLFTQKAIGARSPTCIEVAGQNQRDVDNALSFCAKGIGKGAVTGVIAMDSLVFIKVTRQMADALRVDRLQGEQLVKTWMKGWRTTTGKQSVTVTVELGDVEIARGDSTLLSGDRVTFR
jgi:hypothetical protein